MLKSGSKSPINGIDCKDKIAILDAGAQYGKVSVLSHFILWYGNISLLKFKALKYSCIKHVDQKVFEITHSKILMFKHTFRSHYQWFYRLIKQVKNDNTGGRNQQDKG